ncbi:hypothetical protein BJV77DRAFT_965843 [Russula vinacea]|nr:hypothetical protein BJV77DRAFT_965843 [Russula vinacea]
MAATVVTSQVRAAGSTPPRMVSARTAVNSDSLAASAPFTTTSSTVSKSPRSAPQPTLSATRSKLAHSQVMPQPSSSDSAPMTFKRWLHSPFEQTIRSATRSKGKHTTPLSSSPLGNHFPFITVKDDNRGAQEGTEVKVAELVAREDGKKERTGVFKRFETKVPLRRTRKVSVTESRSDAVPPPTFNQQGDDLERQDSLLAEYGKDQHRFRLPGFTSFVTPSLRLASLSSPAIHLSSNDPPSPSSLLPSSSSRPLISTPAPLTPKRPSVANANSPTSRLRKTRPAPLLPPSPSTPTLDYYAPSSAPAPTTPIQPVSREPVSSSTGTLTPTSSPSRNSQQQRQQLGKRSSLEKSEFFPYALPALISRGYPTWLNLRLDFQPQSQLSAILLGKRDSAILFRSAIALACLAAYFFSDFSVQSSPRALPSSQQRQRAVSPPTVLTRHANGSTTSVSAASGPSNPMHREAVRAATSFLCKEFCDRDRVRVSAYVNQRRLKCVCGRSLVLSVCGGKVGPLRMGALPNWANGFRDSQYSGEERERRLFSEALRDGYVLCQLMNKLRPGSIARIDAREDGKLRMSNDLFLRDDLIEATSDSLARVAKTIIALIKWADTPIQTHSRATPSWLSIPHWLFFFFFLLARSHVLPQLVCICTLTLTLTITIKLTAFPYHHPEQHEAKGTSSPSPPSAGGVGLPTLQSTSLEFVSSRSDAGTLGSGGGAETDGYETPTRTSDRDEVPPIPPPRSPLRSRPSERSLIASGAGELPSFGRESVRASVADSTMTTTNQSIASSSNITDMTTYSSLLDTGINGNGRHSGLGAGASHAHGKFGTIRTVTTEATSFVLSEWPSMTRTEASMAAASMAAACDDDDDTGGGGDGGGSILNQRRRGSLENIMRPRERRPSETVPVDLLRVVEESEEPNPSGGCGSSRDNVARRSAVPVNGRVERIKLVRLATVTVGTLTPHRPTTDTSSRHSVDTPGLAPQPRDTSQLPFPRESSPDNASHLAEAAPAPDRAAWDYVGVVRAVCRYCGEKEWDDDCDDDGGGDTFVTAIPFPRAVSSSGEYVPSPSSLNAPSSSLSNSVERSSSNEHTTGSGPGTPSSIGSGSLQQQQAKQQPLPPRGRFQSETDGASSRRRRPRPNSYDEFGFKAQRRSRFESMANLGVASGAHASASDLMARDATEGSVSRQTLVVREEGKPPTHFQLGNCIGRGQFGSVYRALNLNTGQMVAVKRIGLDGLKEEEISQLMREVDLVKRLTHPSIVKYEGMARDENALSIVLEYAENGSLGQTLKAFGKLNEKLVASYVVKILEGLDYLHQSDVVHCDLKAANILTTKTGNVKLTDFGVSLNLRAMEREIKDVAGTPNWMAPEVIELKVLTGRPPYGDIANAMTVMFRIVEDDCPPIPERFSNPLVAFLKQCFHKDPAQRPSAEELFEHDWLKSHWGLNKDLRPQDSIPFLRRVSADLQKNDAARHMIANLDLVDASPVSEFARGAGARMTASPKDIPEVPQAEPDLFEMREHTFVKTTFSKHVSCRVCMDPVKKGAVLCSHCSLIAHSKCAGRAPPTCDLRSKLLMHAHFAERGSSPADLFTRLPPPPLSPASASDGFGASSSRGSLDRERTNSPQFQPSPLAMASQSPPTPTPTPTHAPHRGLSPFKRSRISLSREDPTHSNSSISLAGAAQQPIKSLLSEGNMIRRKLSIILTRQREPQQPRPLSISSISSSVSPQESQQSNSLRSLQTAAESISSRAARVDTSISAGTGSSSNTDPPSAPAPAPSLRPPPVSAAAAAVLRRASLYSGSDAPSPVNAVSSASASAPTSSSKAPVAAQDTQGTRRGRGQTISSSKTSSRNCAIQ